MAAPTTLIDAKNIHVELGGNSIGCETSGRLRINREARGAAGKCDTEWIATSAAAVDWALEVDTFYLESSNKLDSDDLALTIGGTALKGVTQVDLAFNVTDFRTINTTTGLTGSRGVDSRQVVLSVQASYYDPNGTGAGALLTALNEVRGNTTTAAGLAVALTVGDVDISGNFRPTEVSVEAAKGNHTSVSLTLESTGAVTDATTNADTGMAALLTALFHADGVQNGTGSFTTDSGNTDWTYWSGTVLPTSVQLSIAYPGEVTMSATFSGDGDLTQDQIAAA